MKQLILSIALLLLCSQTIVQSRDTAHRVSTLRNDLKTAKADTTKINALNALAWKYYFKALKIDEELGNKNGIATKLGNIGALYTEVPSLPSQEGQEKKGYALAEDFLIQALAISDSIGALSLQKSHHEKLSELYKKIGDYKKAYQHYEQYSKAKDTIFNEEKSKEIGRLEAGFEFEKQMLEKEKKNEKKQALAKAELKRQRFAIYSTGNTATNR
ncbi:MAG: hypothetical protein HY738_01395 [Bacteroidia bacterium]|nr:hypothetical protein [Bacteroidia bacterium]